MRGRTRRRAFVAPDKRTPAQKNFDNGVGVVAFSLVLGVPLAVMLWSKALRWASAATMLAADVLLPLFSTVEGVAVVVVVLGLVGWLVWRAVAHVRRLEAYVKPYQKPSASMSWPERIGVGLYGGAVIVPAVLAVLGIHAALVLIGVQILLKKLGV